MAAVTTAKDLLGSSAGNSQLGIGSDDNLVVVADLVKKAPTSPAPSDSKAHDVPAGKLPKVVAKKGNPTGLSWNGIAKPSSTTPVQRTVLEKGNGAVVKSTDTVTVNYLGETYKATKPFDESYSAPAVHPAAQRPGPGLEDRPHRPQGRQPRAAADPPGLRVRRAGERLDHPGQRDSVVRHRRGQGVVEVGRGVTG